MGRLLQYKDKKDLFEEILEEWGCKIVRYPCREYYCAA